MKNDVILFWLAQRSAPYSLPWLPPNDIIIINAVFAYVAMQR